MKTGGKPSNQLAGNFRLYRKQKENGKVDLSSHWLAMEQNEKLLVSHTTTE
jgi:hypothetical protein